MAYVGTPIDVGNQFSSLVGKRFSGDASTTAFTLDVRANSALDIEVFVENVRQDPNSAYTVDGTTLTFTASPPSGTNNIYVVHQAPTVASVSPTAGSVTASSFDNSVISGHTALAATPADTDEFLISDAGTIKRIDFSHLKQANTPAFEAYLGSTSSTVSNNVATKVQFNTEVFDSDSKYDNSTNYRFTPTIAGKYFIYAQVYMYMGSSAMNVAIIHIYKNGSAYTRRTMYQPSNPAQAQALNISSTLDLDTDDYVEIYAQSQGADSTFTVNNKDNHFGAYKIIGA